MGKKLYVGNMSYDVDSSALGQLFSVHGTVQSAAVIADRDTGRSKGFGFVEMPNDSEAESAIAAMNGQDNGGRTLSVSEARPKRTSSEFAGMDHARTNKTVMPKLGRAGRAVELSV